MTLCWGGFDTVLTGNTKYNRVKLWRTLRSENTCFNVPRCLQFALWWVTLVALIIFTPSSGPRPLHHDGGLQTRWKVKGLSVWMFPSFVAVTQSCVIFSLSSSPSFTTCGLREKVQLCLSVLQLGEVKGATSEECLRSVQRSVEPQCYGFSPPVDCWPIAAATYMTKQLTYI